MTTPRSPSAPGVFFAMSAAASRMQLKVPMRFHLDDPGELLELGRARLPERLHRLWRHRRN
jgi:hypothetical protein